MIGQRLVLFCIKGRAYSTKSSISTGQAPYKDKYLKELNEGFREGLKKDKKCGPRTDTFFVVICHFVVDYN